MAYAVTNPPELIKGNKGPSGLRVWGYKSADTVATVKGAGYITNGGALGMVVGDFLMVSDTATPLGTLTVVSVVNATTGATTVV